MNQGPYRNNETESIDSLKLRIADLEKGDAELLKKRSRKQRWKSSFCDFGSGFKWLFVKPRRGLRGWAVAVIISSIVAALALVIAVLVESDNRKTREHVRSLQPPPIGCVKVKGSAVCVIPEHQLLHCKSDGCTRLLLKRPEDF